MPRRWRKICHGAHGSLRLFSLFAFTCALTTGDATPLIIDDAGGPSDYNTAPVIGSTVPPGSSDFSIPKWTTQDCVGCPNRPILEKLNDRTYTAIYIPPEVTYTYNISFQFNGELITPIIGSSLNYA